MIKMMAPGSLVIMSCLFQMYTLGTQFAAEICHKFVFDFLLSKATGEVLCPLRPNPMTCIHVGQQQRAGTGSLCFCWCGNFLLFS